MTDIQIGTFINNIAFNYLEELKRFREKHCDNKLGEQEFNYHYGSSGKRKRNDPGYVFSDLVETRLNNLFPGYKILCDRTQDYLYELALENVSNVDFIINKRLDCFIKWRVLHHPMIEEYMKPLVDEYCQFIDTRIDRVNNIPGPEQRTPAWFEARYNAISASICGYADSLACRHAIYEEKKQVREKSGLEPKKQANYRSEALKHGSLFEGLTENFYSTIKGYNVAEYGLIIDPAVPHIGASPDGIVLKTNSDSYVDRKRHGRMLEIKNPVSRPIDRTIPSEYYWQMLQQMWVCQLPFCDFLRTKFTYKECFNWDTFYASSFNILLCINTAPEWHQLYNHFAGYLLDNCKFDRVIDIWNRQHTDFDTHRLADLPRMLSDIYLANFEEVTGIPLININHHGQVRGILREYKKNNYEEVDCKYTPISMPLSDRAQIENMITEWDREMSEKGFEFERMDFWDLETYMLSEVEYNGQLYDNGTENSILTRLTRLWDFILELRSISDPALRIKKYQERYPGPLPVEKPAKTVVYMLD